MAATRIHTMDELAAAVVVRGSNEPSTQVADKELIVDASLIEHLLRRHDELLLDGAIRWRALTVEGELRLNNLQLGRSLTFESCRFVEPGGQKPATFDVEDSSFSSLELSACSLWKLSGRGVTVGSTLRIRNCEVASQIWLVDCRIGGSVSVSGTKIHALDAKENALNLYRAQIGGALYGDRGPSENGEDRQPFSADGRVRLIDASIDGVISLVGAQIANTGSTALSGDRLRAATLLLKGAGTRIEGRVSLVGAEFSTSVNLREASFVNPGRVALQLNGLRVGFRLRLDPYVVDGSLRMRNARLGVFTYGPLALSSCREVDSSGTTFDAVGYMDGPDSVELAPPSIEDLVSLLCERSTTPTSSCYQNLAAALRRQGEFQQARVVGIAGARANALAQPTPWRWLQRIAGAPFAYGFKPERALAILLVTMVLLGLVVANSGGLMVANEPGRCGTTHPCLQPAAYAVDVVLPIVDLGQDSSWHVDNSSAAGEWIQVLVWLSIASGWLASTAFVVALQRHFRE